MVISLKVIIQNKDNVLDSEVTDISIRVKALIINSKNEMLVGFSHGTYQFIGGHVEKGEDLVCALNREIKEESGIEFKIDKIDAFAKRLSYYKNYPNPDDVTKVEIYYYKIFSDVRPNLDNTSYTEDEIFGMFKLEYIPIKSIKEKLIHNTVIENEMKEIIDILS